MSDENNTGEPKLLFPQLKPFYDKVEPISWLLVRLAVGLILIPHGWPKLMMGIDTVAQRTLAGRGIEPAYPLAIALIVLETLGGLCVALGLFTRFWAAAIAVEMAIIVHAHLGAGFGWTNRGYEYPLMWGVIMLAVALRGGGPYSVDQRLGKQL